MALHRRHVVGHLGRVPVEAEAAGHDPFRVLASVGQESSLHAGTLRGERRVPALPVRRPGDPDVAGILHHHDDSLGAGVAGGDDLGGEIGLGQRRLGFVDDFEPPLLLVLVDPVAVVEADGRLPAEHHRDLLHVGGEGLERSDV